MVTLHRAAAWQIAVYGRDHGIPHFHVEGPGFRGSVTIETLELIVGAVPAAILTYLTSAYNPFFLPAFSVRICLAFSRYLAASSDGDNACPIVFFDIVV